jgi:hypothetical protein
MEDEDKGGEDKGDEDNGRTATWQDEQMPKLHVRATSPEELQDIQIILAVFHKGLGAAGMAASDHHKVR